MEACERVDTGRWHSTLEAISQDSMHYCRQLTAVFLR